MKEKKRAPSSKAAGFSPASFLWIKQEFDDLHREHAVIIKKLNDLHDEHLLILKKLGSGPGLITPELESAVNKAAALALKIDQQVPD